ncbi:MAG: glycosyltransferase family 4 protein [Puniceicoccaceae bacterium]|nr:glycosyltransferase family 4 protein [Puniceicoccaceae bacterium]
MSSVHKRFLIITQVFTPDPAAVGQYFDEAAQAIAGTGAKVTVLTANRGYDNPNARFTAKEDRDGINIRRLPLSSFGKASIPVRIFAQLSFLIQSILRGLFTPKLTDLLVSTSPPMAAITAVVIGFFRPKLKVHYWVMDINPDQAVILGAFGPRHPLVLALDWLNRRILKRADSVIALDRFMAARMAAKLQQPTTVNEQPVANKLTILPPWPMDDYLEVVPHNKNPFRKAQGWEDKFVVMYSGNHSLVHPLDTILNAAEQLKDDPRFIFAFIGGGKGKAVVDARINEWDSGNLGKYECKDTLSHIQTSPHSNSRPSVVSLPYQPLDQIRYSLSAADLHIVSLGDNMSGIVHPCKIYGALSIGRPVLALGPKQSYLNDIIDGNDIGRSIEHGDVDAAVAALQAAADQTQEERVAIGQRAQQVATEKFSREQLVHQFLETVLKAENILQGSP